MPTDEMRSVRKVSHTLTPPIAEKLALFGFREKMSESAVIEVALVALFGTAGESELGVRLREMGCRKRRKIGGNEARHDRAPAL